MSKIQIVYWTGTGNTAIMADLIRQGVEKAGKEAEIIEVANADASALLSANVFALGCPAMGDEVLEESEFDPFFESIEGSISGKTIALFGSYGWGDGQWMRDWQDRVAAAGATVVNGEGLIVNAAPEGESADMCIALGEALANA